MKKRFITEKIIKDFEMELKNNEKSSNTIEKYLRDVRCFGTFAGEHTIDKALVLEYKAQLENDYAIASANSMLAAINSFFKFVGWYDCCVKQFKVQRKTYCSEESELTKQEYIALVRAAEHKKNERLSLLIRRSAVQAFVLVSWNLLLLRQLSVVRRLFLVRAKAAKYLL